MAKTKVGINGLGIRPQDLTLTNPTTPGDLSATVWLVELVGSEKLVNMTCGDGVQLMAEVKAEHDIAAEQALQSLPLGVLVTKESQGKFTDFSGCPGADFHAATGTGRLSGACPGEPAARP